MALINCPECSKEISDKSDKCIHCGYPLRKTNTCVLNGKETNLSFLLDESYSILYKVRDMIQLSGSSIVEVKPIVEKIIETKTIPPILNLPIQEQQSVKNNTTKCPKCGSTNIQIVPRKWSLLTGFLTNKTDRVCVNCNHKF